MSLIDELEARWVPTVERCGYITPQGEVVELPNLASDPENAFEMELPEGVEITATWHTHRAGVGSNLSVPDYLLYLSQPHLWHYIIGGPGDTRAYYVENGVVLLHD